MVRGVVVTDYIDEASATMVTKGNGGAFSEAVLRPRVRVAETAMVEPATAAHDDAHEWCFIANSVNFPVRVEPVVEAG